MLDFSVMLDAGCWILKTRKSRIKDQGSNIKDQASRIKY